ncbi:hypothetical protein ABZ990_17425 [Streptomyces sp. NPDC046203]|uniref:hypothetical protein n=1 Tax=Streptomyces sp. NPDC046203 TaxID=3154602 RepID=UPI0033F85381
MTAPRRELDEPAGPATPDLYDQWAAARLEALQEGLVDLVGALLVAESGEDPGLGSALGPGRDSVPR